MQAQTLGVGGWDSQEKDIGPWTSVSWSMSVPSLQKAMRTSPLDYLDSARLSAVVSPSVLGTSRSSRPVTSKTPASQGIHYLA